MRKLISGMLFVAMLVIGTLLVCPAQAELKGAEADLEKGWQNLDTALLDKTLKVFEEMAKKNPKDHLAPYNAARAHFAIADCLDIKSSEEFDKSGKSDTHIDAGMALIDTAIGLKEDNPAAHALKFHLIRRKMLHVSFPGLMMYISSRRAAADRAIELAPKDPDCQYIAALQETEGTWPPPAPEESSAVFAGLLKQNPKMAAAAYEMGVTWEKAKKMDEAVKHYKKALELDANHHWAKKKLKGLAVSNGA
ncbi:hypothetical protein ACFL43_01960 [Thermodesulfobacteriota bacterium]